MRRAYLRGMKGCPAPDQPRPPESARPVALAQPRAPHPGHPHRPADLRLLSLELGQVYQGGKVLSRLYLHRQDSKGKRTGSYIVIHPRAAVALTKWIESPLGPTQPDHPLFPSQRHPDRALDRHTGWLILHPAFVAAGVTGMAGSHCLRKTYCANVRAALGGDIFRLSKAMRHTSVFTTLA